MNGIRVPSKQNDGYFEPLCPQPASSLQAVQARHGQIHNDQVGAERLDFFEGIQSIDGFAANSKPWETLEIVPGGGANYFAVVDEQDVYGHWIPPRNFRRQPESWRAPD